VSCKRYLEGGKKKGGAFLREEIKNLGKKRKRVSLLLVLPEREEMIVTLYKLFNKKGGTMTLPCASGGTRRFEKSEKVCIVLCGKKKERTCGEEGENLGWPSIKKGEGINKEVTYYSGEQALLSGEDEGEGVVLRYHREKRRPRRSGQGKKEKSGS